MHKTLKLFFLLENHGLKIGCMKKFSPRKFLVLGGNDIINWTQGRSQRSSPTSLSLQMPKIDRWPQEELGEEHTYGKIIKGNLVH